MSFGVHDSYRLTDSAPSHTPTSTLNANIQSQYKYKYLDLTLDTICEYMNV